MTTVTESGDYRTVAIPISAGCWNRAVSAAGVWADRWLGRWLACPYDVPMSKARISHIQLLRFAGLFTYACVGAPFLRYRALLEDAVLQGRPVVHIDLWLGCYLLFGLVFWVLTDKLGREIRPQRTSATQIGLLATLNVTAILIGYFSQSGLSALLLVVVAVVLPWLMPVRVAWAWAVLQNYTLVPVFAAIPGWNAGQAVLQASLYLGLSVLAFVAALEVKQQTDAREQQRQLNAELRATRALLAESSRLAERMRISRELHDLVGHHLTGLSLNLEVASHLADGKAKEHVDKAQSVAKLLLQDVREVVSQLREEGSIDLGGALQELIEGVPGLTIHLTMPDRFSIDDPQRAQVMLRCAQEMITNTIRHARARNLWIEFSLQDEYTVIINARDDGRGATHWQAGNGLAGMKERLAQFGGQLSISTARGEGFALSASLSLERPA